MATSTMSEVLQHLRRLVLLRDGAGLTDGQLLEDYLSLGDTTALAALVHRHGAMVWSLCRRLLRNEQDAEDAFQTTFLVFVRKAGSIVPREMVANWLYGVAHQTALKARATAAGRKRRERQVADMPEPAVTDQGTWPDLQLLLDEELSRLPNKYRAVLVLCGLEGKTRKEAARHLGCPEGTVAGRLARARIMLAKRLAHQGLVVSGEGLAGTLAQAASAGVPTSVMWATIKAASQFAAGSAAASGVIPAQVAALTEGVLKTMLFAKLKVVLVLLVVVALCGAAGLIYQTKAAEPPKSVRTTEKADQDLQRPAPAAEPEKILFEDHFQGGPSAEWSTLGAGKPQNLDPAYAVLRQDPDGRHFVEFGPNGHAGKNASQWKDYRLTFRFRLPQPAADGHELLRVIVRGPALNIWGGYNIYLFNAEGKFKLQANVWPTNPFVKTAIPVDSQWHQLSVSVLGQELEMQLDNRSDAKIATKDVYDASAVGGIYLGFMRTKWQLADVRVAALRPVLKDAEVLAQYCRFAYYSSLDKLTVKADLAECSDQAWVRQVTAIRVAVVPAGKERGAGSNGNQTGCEKSRYGGSEPATSARRPVRSENGGRGNVVDRHQALRPPRLPMGKEFAGSHQPSLSSFRADCRQRQRSEGRRTGLSHERPGAVGPGAVARPRTANRPDHPAMRDGSAARSRGGRAAAV